MKRIAIYFHGFGSSAQSDKVDRLKNSGYDVYSFDIDPDPAISIPKLIGEIDKVLVEAHPDNVDLVMIGTSLGGWYASKIADLYHAKAIIINPCYDPKIFLKKYAVKSEILDRYIPMVFNKNYTYYIGTKDSVIDFSPVRDELSKMNTIYVSAEHRFNGKEFDMVVNELRGEVGERIKSAPC